MRDQDRVSSSRVFLILIVTGIITISTIVQSNPLSVPYVPFRTSPLDQEDKGIRQLWRSDEYDQLSTTKQNKPGLYNQKMESESYQCPLQFSLGISRRAHHLQQHSGSTSMNHAAITSPPNIYPVHPSYGPGRQVIHTTQHELLDLLSPIQLMDKSSIIKEGLQQHADFPLLLESSSFHSSPLIHDANGDGIADAIVVDYDGGIYIIGLQVDKEFTRFFSRGQMSRLYVRRSWMEARLNETLPASNSTADDADSNSTDPEDYYARMANQDQDHYHSYFEYNSKANDDGKIQGKAANILNQGNEDIKGLEERRQRRVNHTRPAPETPAHDQDANETRSEDSGSSETPDYAEAVQHRRLAEFVDEGDESDVGKIEEADETVQIGEDERIADTGIDPMEWEDVMGGEGGGGGWGDDDYTGGEDENYEREDDYMMQHGDDAYYGGGDRDYYGDDYYGYHRDYDDFYSEEKYIRLPPHVLSPPVLVEMPKLYSSENEKQEMIFVAVSYYLDEDEYEGFFSYKRFDSTDEGDEDETKRGMYVASAIVVYELSDGKSTKPRFGREEHLDLSGDWTSPQNMSLVAEVPVLLEDGNKMGAFALAPPTVADIDGSGEDKVLLGTSMGIVYCLHARHLYKVDGWPVQVKHPIESRILVEDTRGDTNLEIYVLDTVGNIYCLDHRGQLLWRRDLLSSMTNGGSFGEVRGLSEMAMGDVNGDGVIDIVVVMKLVASSGDWATFVFAVSSTTGDDLDNFPIEFDTPLLVDDGTAEERLVQKLPQPLLIDLHGDQSHWMDYLRRNGTRWEPKIKPPPGSKEKHPQGGSSPGLHIVQPVGSNVYVIEAGSGCIQSISIGEEVSAMVQADDVHGTNNLDLVISTMSGNIVTLDSPAVPYHPLNVWNTGVVRGRRNNFAQGFTASQGIFVHQVSRQYRDVFGVYVPVTLEIFDNRPNVMNEPDKRKYLVEIRDGTSAQRAVFRKEYDATGIYTERLYMSYGPGYYTLTVLMRTSHGIFYEDTFHLGYNVHFMDGFGTLLWLPLLLAMIPILFCSKKKASWDDEDFNDDDRGGRGLGILGRATS